MICLGNPGVRDGEDSQQRVFAFRVELDASVKDKLGDGKHWLLRVLLSIVVHHLLHQIPLFCHSHLSVSFEL